MGEKATMALGFALFIIIIALIVTVVILLFPGETTEDKEIREMQEKIDNKILDAANKIKISAEHDAEYEAEQSRKMIESYLKTIDETEERATVELTREAEYQNLIKSTLTDEEIEWLDLVEDEAIPEAIKIMGGLLGLCESIVSYETYLVYGYTLNENGDELDEMFYAYLRIQEIIKEEYYTEYGNIRELSLEFQEIMADLADCAVEKYDKYE